MSTDREWWRADEIRGEIEEAISHINGSRRRSGPVNSCDQLFKALNKLWTARQRVMQNTEASDSQAIQGIMKEGIPVSRIHSFCESTTVTDFAALTPPVMNHNVLRHSPHYELGKPIPHKLAKEAAREHQRFKNAYSDWRSTSSDRTRAKMLERLAEVLYVVRSNIMHGEKTPAGPDLQKARRDRLICTMTEPLLDAFLEVLFDYPSNRLVAYGTLAPGQPNYHLLADLSGSWKDCQIRGIITNCAGLVELIWTSDGPCNPAKLFESKELRGAWEKLDRFEGSYTRILATIEEVPERVLAIANVYGRSESRDMAA